MEANNVKAAEVDIIVFAGDAIEMTFETALNGSDYSFVGKQVDMKIKRFDGTELQSLSSAGASPLIALSGKLFTISPAAITEVSIFEYDTQITDAGKPYTFMKGKVIVKKSIT
jgi:hypothetical protein